MLKLFKTISPELKYSGKRMFSQMKSYSAGESHVQLGKSHPLFHLLNLLSALKLSSKNVEGSDLVDLEPVNNFLQLIS